MKKIDIIYIGIVFNYPECSKDRLLNCYPLRDELECYLPDNVSISNINKAYLLNVP